AVWVDLELSGGLPQRSAPVGVLQSEPKWGEVGVADGAGRIFAVLLHPLPDGAGKGRLRILLKLRYIRRGGGRGGAENVLEDPLSALDRGCSRRVGRDGEHAAL